MLFSSSVEFGWSSTLPNLEFAPDESLSAQEMIPKLNINSRKMVKILFIFFSITWEKLTPAVDDSHSLHMEYSCVVKRPDLMLLSKKLMRMFRKSPYFCNPETKFDFSKLTLSADFFGTRDFITTFSEFVKLQLRLSWGAWGCLWRCWAWFCIVHCSKLFICCGQQV